MATEVARLVATLDADTRRFDSAMGRSESRMSKVGRVAGLAGAAILGGLGVAAVKSAKSLQRIEEIGAQTEAVIKSTGGVANVTRKQVDDLAGSLEMMSGVEAESITIGENMLLTFKGIRNETGMGNDIFNQATRATLDLSVAMGKDMQDSAIMVGKALNDPIRGLTAMRRVGIQFTKQQEEQIKRMVESGDVMGAQKVILKELESQFGGSAEAAGKTMGGQIRILMHEIGTLGEELTRLLIPALRGIVPIVRNLVGWFTEHETIAKVLAVGLAGLAVALVTFSVAMKIATAAQAIFNVVMAANPVVLVVAAVVALGIALVIAYKKSETFRRIVNKSIDWVKRNWDLLLMAMFPLAGLFVTLWRRSETFRAVVTGVMDVVRGSVNKMRGALERVRDFMSLVRQTARFTFEFFRDKVNMVRDAAQTVIDKIRAIIKWVKDMVDKVSGPLGKVAGFFGAVGGAVGKVIPGDFGVELGQSAGIVGLGRQLQAMGFAVGEHPAFGGVSGVHVPGSYHYSGRALDINADRHPWGETRALDWLYKRLRPMYDAGILKELLWRTTGHFNHLHLAMAQGGTILARRPTPVVMGEGGAEVARFWPLGRGPEPGGGVHHHWHIPRDAVIVDGAKLTRLIDDARRTYERRGGR